MTTLERPDPTDLAGLRNVLGLDDPASALRPIGLRRLVIGDSALDELPELVRSLARPGPLIMLVDQSAMRRGQRDLKAGVLAQLETIGAARALVLGVPGQALHASEEVVKRAIEGCRGAGCVVAVGSGTICDIGKEATRAANAPYVVVQTAGSVNGFADDMAVLLVNGVKRTVPSRWPDALIIDLQVLAGAPLALNQAGLGEMLATFTAPADWCLAAAIGMDESYDGRIVELYRAGALELLDSATAVSSADPAALRLLAELLTLSGLGMAAAGRTAPSSGTEHTVSHLLDMAAARAGQPGGLHGAQVGLAALAAAVAWQRLLDTIDPERLLIPAPDRAEQARARIEHALGGLDSAGEMGRECWHDYSLKLGRWSDLDSDLRSFVEGWDSTREELRALLGSPAAMAAALRASGAPATFAELDPPVTPQAASWALYNGHLIRNRFVLADLAWFAGAWTPEFVDQVIDEATALGGR